MKKYTVIKINFGRLYFYGIIGVLITAVLMILITGLVQLIFPEFKKPGLILVLVAVVFGHLSYKFSYSKASNKIEIKLNNKKMVIEENEFLLDTIKSLKIKGYRFNNYPKFKLKLTDNERFSFRLSKEIDFYKFYIALKDNSKINKAS